MTNNKNNSSPELNDPQGIDRSLLEYLKPKSEDRYSKLEAYCDLLTRATSGTYSTSRCSRKSEITSRPVYCHHI